MVALAPNYLADSPICKTLLALIDFMAVKASGGGRSSSSVPLRSIKLAREHFQPDSSFAPPPLVSRAADQMDRCRHRGEESPEKDKLRRID